MDGSQFMFHDARGERGPYTAMHAEGPWFCMVPGGVEVPPDSPVLQSGGMVGLPTLMHDHGETFHAVGWAMDKSLRSGLRPGLHGSVGWTPVDEPVE